MRRHLPIALSIAALLVALLGAAPFGNAAGSKVLRTLFADNAGEVNGFAASSVPRPNTLLALDTRGKFPASVLPPTLTWTPASAARTKQQFFFITLGAIVRSDGTVVRTYPTGGVAVTRLGLGRYRITFNRNVRNCLQLATIRTFLVGEDEPTAEYIHVAIADSNPNRILVETARRPIKVIIDSGPPSRVVDVAGQVTSADSGFNVAVFCTFF